MFGRRLKNDSSFADLAAPAKEHFSTSAKSKGGLIEENYYQADLPRFNKWSGPVIHQVSRIT